MRTAYARRNSAPENVSTALVRRSQARSLASPSTQLTLDGNDRAVGAFNELFSPSTQNPAQPVEQTSSWKSLGTVLARTRREHLLHRDGLVDRGRYRGVVTSSTDQTV